MHYAKNAWYVAGFEMDLDAGRPVATSILGEPIVLYRTASGKIVALEDRCVHRLAPLSLGRCEGDNLRCMYHGLLFDPDGKCIEIPGQELIPAKAKVRPYPVVVKHSHMWLWMGDPARADEALIAPSIGYDDPDYLCHHGHVDFAAEARLIGDNLLDFSHVPYTHLNSFDLGQNYADERPVVSAIEQGVRIDRWTTATLGAATGRAAQPVDHFVTYDYLIPGIFLAWSGFYPLGTADALEQGRPDYSQAFGVNFTTHAVTPMTEKTSRFTYLTCLHRSYATQEALDGMAEIQRRAYDEDRTVIEAQQHTIDLSDDPKVMPSAHDQSLTLYHRMLDQRVEADGGSTQRAA